MIHRLPATLCTIFLAVVGLISESRAANTSGECYVTVSVAGGTLPAGWSYQLQYYDTDSNWYNGASGNSTQTYYKQQGDWLNKSIQWRCQLKQNNTNYGTAQTSTCFAGSDTVSFSVAAPVAAIPPTISVQPASQSSSPGASVTFSVTATGTAPLIYQWRKNGSSISNANADSYTIASVSSGDAGNYSCYVSNTAGDATSQVAVLAVNGTLDPPVVDSDSDGLDDTVETNTGVYVSPSDTGTNPGAADSDGDGVADGLEVKEKTSPVDATKFNSFSKGMLAYWPFNGNAKDETGRGNNGIPTDVVAIPDRLSKPSAAFQFNGTSSTIRVPTSITAGKDLTFSFWGKYSPASSLQSVISRDSWHNGYLHCGVSATNLSLAVAADNPQGYSIEPYGHGQWSNEDWNHVVFVRSAIDTNYRIYVNGALIGQQDQTYLHSPSSIAPLQIGAWVSLNGLLERFFEGSLDDLRIYDRALSQDEVEALNHAERGQAIVTVAATSNGSITGSGEYDPGTPATLTAVPNPGYRFIGWTGDVSGTENPLTITMDADKTLGATFEKDLTDADSDGLSAYDELVVHGTDPALADSDSDGLSDGYELGIGRFSIVTGSFTWQQARADASSKGGDLASFPTEDRWNRALQNLAVNPFEDFIGLWIGASDAAADGTWTWVNGEAFIFAPWGTGRPSSTTGNSLDFAEVSGGGGAEIGKWYDRSPTTIRDGYLLETGYATSPTVADADGDGLNDGQEQTAGTSPTNADTDGDGLSDGQEINLTGTNPKLADTNGDGTNDAESDQDDDGVSNLAEIATHGTDPLKADTDGDGLSDGEELNHPGRYFTLVEGTFTQAQAAADAATRRGRLASFPNANDFTRAAGRARKATQGYLWFGLSDAATEGTWLWSDGNAPAYTRWLNGQPDGGTAENHAVLMEATTQWADAVADFVTAGYLFERVGLDPLAADTDGDGLSDGAETNTHQTNPVLDDSDSDGLTDGTEINTHGSNPKLADTDSDGLSDFAEVVTHGTNPTAKDSDGDGFDDLFEINTGFNPTLDSSTPDALSTIRTAVEFRFNAGNGASYRIEGSTDLQNWETVETDIIGTGGVVTRFYSIENQPKRYFRVKRN